MKRKPSKKRSKPVTAKQVQSMECVAVRELPQVPIRAEEDEGPFNDDGLSIRQLAFVDALTGPAGGVAYKAAEMAGYRGDNMLTLAATASRLLNNVKVQEAVSRALARKRMSPEWARERLLELAAASMRNFVSVGEDGELHVDWTKAAEAGAIGQIGSITEDVMKSSGSVSVIKRTFKLHNPTRAIELVLRLGGLLKDEAKIELTGPNGGPVKTETLHSFDYEQYQDLFRQRSAHANGNGSASANGN